MPDDDLSAARACEEAARRGWIVQTPADRGCGSFDIGPFGGLQEAEAYRDGKEPLGVVLPADEGESRDWVAAIAVRREAENKTHPR